MDERLRLLVKDKVEDIKNKTVILVGVGGVGGYALEALVRAGIGKIIIVDYDTVDITNLNRQIISLRSNIGESKVDVAEKRIKEINPDCNVIKYNMKLDKESTSLLFENDKVDYVIDACDTLEVKEELIRLCHNKYTETKLISSMGTGNKMDPSKLEITDITKTSYDPLAKKIRKMAKDERIKGKVIVVSSTERPIDVNSRTIGSNSFVPATAGLLCASYVINDIVGDLWKN